MATKTKETAVAVADNFIVPSVGALDDWSEELDGFKLNFDRVKIPSGGGNQFEIVRDGEDSEFAAELVGVIVDQHPANAYWRDEFTGEGNQPDCSSLDGKVGVGDPGGNCRACPLGGDNAFGSAANGAGKACKNMRRVYLLQEGETFPLLLTLPPTSAPALGSFLGKRLMPRGIKRHEAIVKITLNREKNKAGITYSKASFSLVDQLPTEKAEEMRQYVSSIRAITRSLDMSGDDYSNGNGNGSKTVDDDDLF